MKRRIILSIYTIYKKEHDCRSFKQVLTGFVFVQRELSIQFIIVAVVPTFIFINCY